MVKNRLDLVLVSRDLARSRTEAQDLIKHGKVLVNGAVISKQNAQVRDIDSIRVTDRMPFVSRGGLKLAHALDTFHLGIGDGVFLDVGSSTGGFTDVLLKRGARKIYAVDVGTEQMEHKLRLDSRVVLMEQTDIRTLETLPEQVDGIVVDVSFISLTHIFPVLPKFLKHEGFVVALVKPQFEVGRTFVGKNGVVVSEEARKMAVENILSSAAKAGFSIEKVTDSPILGGEGNKEFLLLCKKHD